MGNKGQRAGRWVAAGLGVGIFGAALLGPVKAKGQGGPPPPPPPPTLKGVTAQEQADFLVGLNIFLRALAPRDGLGPVFNGVACAECHRQGGPGGSAPDLNIGRVTRIGAVQNGVYTDLADKGGPVLQRRSLRELQPNYPVPGEVVPVEAQFVSRRLTTPVFGDGLIEAIPDTTIRALAKRSLPDGIRGVANLVRNPETGKVEVGRFGWKSQISTIHWFTSDAFLNESGITSRSFPSENLPQGRPIPPGADQIPDPEERPGDVEAMTAFMRFAAPPTAELPNSLSIRGEAVFNQINCASCHVSELKTGANPSRALSNVSARLYSDLLLHSMGDELADGIQQGLAKGDQYRTAPLWGLSQRRFFLHDGRSTTIDDAIRKHGGEATLSRNRYVNLTLRERTAILEFLSGL